MTLALLLLTADLVPRPVWTGGGVTLLGAPAFDDSYLSVVDPESRGIARRPLRAGAKIEPLASAKTAAEFAYFSVPSRDGRQIAYAWFNRDGFYELRVASDTGQRTVYRNEEAGFVQPTSWTPDGQSILTLLFRRDNTSQIAMINVTTGKARVLKSLEWVYPKKMDLSPDGRWIVYDTFPGTKPAPRDLYLLASDGIEERRLTDHPADDLFPMFSPDGRQIVFASDRAGSLDLYTMEVAGPTAPPRLILKSPGRYLPLGVTRNGKLYYGLRAGAGVHPVIEGKNTGRFAVAAARPASENYGLGATVIFLKNADEAWRPLDLPLAHVEKARWSPNGKRLLVSGTDGKGRPGLFLADPQTAAVQPVVLDEYATAKGVEGVWVGAERVAYLMKGTIRERDLATGEDRERATIDAVALGGGPNGLLAATPSQVLHVDKGQWPVRGIEQVEWWGERIVVTRGSSVAALDDQGAAKMVWKTYRGGAIHASHDGSAIAYTVDDTKQEVWVLENVWSHTAAAGR